MLLDLVASDDPAVVHVHGLGGIGKSVLMNAFVERVRGKRVPVVSLDCRIVEPSERGFLNDLGTQLGEDTSSIQKATSLLASLGDRVVLALDSYERFRAMDTWFRGSFLPAMNEGIRVFFFGRDAPVPIWLIAPEWQNLFHSITLGPLADEASAELLRRSGLKETDITRIVRFAHGNPLALRLAAAAVLERPELDLEKITSQTVITELTKTWISDVRDPATRSALEGFSVVRRLNNSLLKFILPSIDSDAVYSCLQQLTFVAVFVKLVVASTESIMHSSSNRRWFPEYVPMDLAQPLLFDPSSWSADSSDWDSFSALLSCITVATIFALLYHLMGNPTVYSHTPTGPLRSSEYHPLWGGGPKRISTVPAVTLNTIDHKVPILCSGT
jgi:hypothetical protein